MTTFLCGYGHLEIQNFSSSVAKYLKYFTTFEDKFRISARPCNILYIFYPRKAFSLTWAAAIQIH